VDARHKAGHDEIHVIDEKTQAALSQIGREEKAAAADEVSPIVRHRASITGLKPSYGLAVRPAADKLLQGSPNGRVNISIGF